MFYSAEKKFRNPGERAAGSENQITQLAGGTRGGIAGRRESEAEELPAAANIASTAAGAARKARCWGWGGPQTTILVG